MIKQPQSRSPDQRTLHFLQQPSPLAHFYGETEVGLELDVRGSAKQQSRDITQDCVLLQQSNVVQRFVLAALPKHM